jgi:hypothetical protein
MRGCPCWRELEQRFECRSLELEPEQLVVEREREHRWAPIH